MKGLVSVKHPLSLKSLLLSCRFLFEMCLFSPVWVFIYIFICKVLPRSIEPMTAAPGGQSQSHTCWYVECWSPQKNKIKKLKPCCCLCCFRCVKVLSWSTRHGEVWWMRKLWLRPWKKAGYGAPLWTSTSRSLSGINDHKSLIDSVHRVMVCLV